ncbi:hypothetical protein SNE40_012870 [Patella caerulea]|uniref:Beta-1,4-galactosyltransferase n=2 Tax=Patella caerulea TaxID=87958 RepID=A0AAN8PSV9_PATCE
MARVLRRVFYKYRLFLFFILMLTIIGSCFLALYPIPEQKNTTNVKDDQGENVVREETKNVINKHEYESRANGHKLAVLVPFRDRFEELMDFVPHMTKFLNAQKVRHKIFAINQIDNYRFNRASLINIGFLESKSECDYIAMHDVDLLPLNSALNYSYPENGAFHVAAPELHPLYHYKKFVGGILLVKGSDFEKLNGLSNKYWGWGLEDDEFFVRMKKLGIKITRPVGITTGNQTFKHVHDRRRTRDKSRFFDQKEKTRRLDKITGVNSVDYTVDSKHELTIDDGYVTVINVKLKCDLNFTPWCLVKEDHEVYLKLIENQANKNKIKKK